MARPVIGVCGPDRGGFPAWSFTALAILRAGGRPVRIRPSRPKAVQALDGLVLGGGADVSPEHYGMEALEIESGQQKPGAADWAFGVLLVLLRWLFGVKFGRRKDAGRDDLEFELFGEAVRSGVPVLGICRGCQLMNVSLGGTLHQELGEFYEESPQLRSVLPRKQVLLEPQSRLASLFGRRTAHVNALHRQAVKDVAPGLHVAAREANGVIQAVERPEGPFCVGVQWHPEYMPQSSLQMRLFRALIEAAKG